MAQCGGVVVLKPLSTWKYSCTFESWHEHMSIDMTRGVPWSKSILSQLIISILPVILHKTLLNIMHAEGSIGSMGIHPETANNLSCMFFLFQGLLDYHLLHVELLRSQMWNIILGTRQLGNHEHQVFVCLSSSKVEAVKLFHVRLHKPTHIDAFWGHAKLHRIASVGTGNQMPWMDSCIWHAKVTNSGSAASWHSNSWPWGKYVPTHISRDENLNPEHVVVATHVSIAGTRRISEETRSMPETHLLFDTITACLHTLRALLAAQA